MLISLIRNNKITNFTLPNIIKGSFWVGENNDEDKNLINIEAINNKWVLKSNFDVSIITQNGKIDSCPLLIDNFYFLKVENEKEFSILFCSNSYEKSYQNYSYKSEELNIGSDSSNDISYKNGLLEPNAAKIYYANEKYLIEDKNSKYGVYVNGKKIRGIEVLNVGDIIFLMGLKIIFMKENILISNNNKSLVVNSKIVLINRSNNNEKVNLEEDNENFYDEEDFFFRSPRFITSFDKQTVTIDSPPAKENPQEMPLFYTVGPMITMGMTSAVTLFSAFSNVRVNNASFSSVLPTVVISASMLLTMILWPVLTKAYQRKQKRIKEQNRQKKYISYLEKKKDELKALATSQKSTMLENDISPLECQDIILKGKRKIWERKIDDEDFLKVRIGIGVLPLNAEIKYSEEHFTLDEDNLREALYDTINSSKKVYDVPITLSLLKKNNLVITGKKNLRKNLVDNILLQLITFQSYEDVKIVFMLKNNVFSYAKSLSHTWEIDKKNRYYASSDEEMNELSYLLETEFSKRQYNGNNDEVSKSDYKSFSPYYVIVTDNIKKVRNLEITNKIFSEERNLGFSLIIMNDGLENLPNECSNFVFLEDNKSVIIENELNSNNQQQFYMDSTDKIDMDLCCEKLSNIPIKFSTLSEKNIPSVINFLEMQNAGTIEQLNIINRWNQNKTTDTLNALVGVGYSNEKIYLDLHEKFHGPHGLIAGMTGSGKSEFIITYILSMAINYHPDDVQFVLIDYKGGGLAGAFEQQDGKVKLPHLVGTITNLDTVELNRSLSSIQSELKRRQLVFNEVKEKLNESTIDIYKYQKLYHQHKVEKPISHLFIICDEFAELKTQQSDFMQQLISTARIGRSLGVHLVLATQKPSGVVDDQIWSNSKFRVCLKVQEKSDSMDVIKRPDAVALKNIGRFYMQVGYNDYFAVGQAAWCGAQYYPMEKLKKQVDKSINFVNNVGQPIKTISDEETIKIDSKGEQLQNLVLYLNSLAKELNIKTEKLWLDKIPEFIYIKDLEIKYSYSIEKGTINPIIGEYDDPSNQRQGLLTLNLTDGGNTIIYGAPNSGKELVLISLIYSSIINYSVDQVNFYIMDFGSEMLKIFKKAPHVGDVILINELEKVTNLFKKLQNEINNRKKIFSNFNGDYKLYSKSGKKSMPLEIVIINGYEAFAETYEDFSNILVQLTREGQRYGIVFVITTSDVNSIRYRILQNFSQSLVLQFNDKADYTSILGNTDGVYPSKINGRGIIRIDEKVYEFQTAYPYVWENLMEYIRIVCEKLNTVTNKKIEEVEILPTIVNYETIKKHIDNTLNLPLGIEKSTLLPIKYDFEKKFVMPILSNDINDLKDFCNSFLKELTFISDLDTIVLDTNGIVKPNMINNDTIDLIDKDFDQSFEKTFNQKKGKRTFVVIIGFDNYLGKLSEKNSKLFKKILSENDNYKDLNMVIFDSEINYRKYEYEEFFKEYLSDNTGIWVGNGFTEQFLLKSTSFAKEGKEDITNSFGFIVINGKYYFVKLIDFSEDEFNNKSNIEFLDFDGGIYGE